MIGVGWFPEWKTLEQKIVDTLSRLTMERKERFVINFLNSIGLDYKNITPFDIIFNGIKLQYKGDYMRVWTYSGRSIWYKYKIEIKEG